MPKPISLLIRDLQTKIVTACNESGLPPSILDQIIGSIHQQISQMVKVEIEQAEKQLAEEENNA